MLVLSQRWRQIRKRNTEQIRDHLDVGRPDQIALIFHRKVNVRTPGTFRTRSSSSTMIGVRRVPLSSIPTIEN